MTRIASDKMKGSLSITRPRGADYEYIELSVHDEMSGTQFVTVRVGLAEFAEALTGLARVPCDFFHRPARVGLQYQHKEEFVPFVDNAWYSNSVEERERIARAAFAPFEVDGWKGRTEDLFNHHRRRPNGARVTFTRYVEPEDQRS